MVYEKYLFFKKKEVGCSNIIYLYLIWVLQMIHKSAYYCTKTEPRKFKPTKL